MKKESSGGTENVGDDDYERDIKLLKHHVAEMTDLALGMVADGARALLTGDKELGRSVTSRDAALDRYDLNVETEAVRLVAVHQPEGRYLRTIESAIKIAGCVDRIGRLGYDMGRNIVPAEPSADAGPRELLRQMDEIGRSMVAQALHAFVADDAAEAKAVFARDDEVDRLYHRSQDQLIALLRQGGSATDRLVFEVLGSRHLERVADNACKIAEKAVYAITGERRSEYMLNYPRNTDGDTPSAH
jgi:phosphate transport system protein